MVSDNQGGTRVKLFGTIIVFSTLLLTIAVLRHTTHLEETNARLQAHMLDLQVELEKVSKNQAVLLGAATEISHLDYDKCHHSDAQASEPPALSDDEDTLTDNLPLSKVLSNVRASTSGRFRRGLALTLAVLFGLAPFVGPLIVDTALLSAVLGRQNDTILLSKRLLYLLDYWFSSYGWIKPLALLVATFWLLLVGGLANFAVSDAGMVNAFWFTWSFIADSGNHAVLEEPIPRGVGVLITLGGMLVFALMLGLVSDSISEKVDSLKKGKSDVIENHHTLILGWNDKIMSIMEQIANANESEGGGVIVVLSERAKEEMEEELFKAELQWKGTVVVCRSGSPLLLMDLRKVSVSTARSIIVLAEARNADLSDTRVLRVVLSLRGVSDLQGHIVAEISDLDNNLQVKMVGGELVETLVAHDVIGRLMIQCARQPGLAQVFEDLLGFEGNEFYRQAWPELVGKTFHHACFAFRDAVPCGVCPEGSSKVLMNPNDEYVIQEGDEILVIAEDNDTYEAGEIFQVPEGIKLPPSTDLKKLQTKERVLFVGWRRDIEDMIVVLDSFVAKDSELWIFCDVPIEEREERLKEADLNVDTLQNLKLVHKLGNPVLRKHLQMLPMATFHSILILADERLEEDIVAADSRVLGTLLIIRELQYVAFERSSRVVAHAEDVEHDSDTSWQTLSVDETDPTNSLNAPVASRRTSVGAQKMDEDGKEEDSWMEKMRSASSRSVVISEILDSRTKHLINVTKISDYVLSNELVSMALAMIAEDKGVATVLSELFTSEGNELYICSIANYINPGEEATFYEMQARCRLRDELLIGYKCASTMDRAVLNPPNKHIPRVWNEDDFLVILAEDE